MTKYRIPLILQFLVFLIPLNIYVIGDWLGTGVQWALLRYQQTNISNNTFNSLILITREIEFVTSGIISGRTGISFIVEGIGACLFIIAMFLVILSYIEENSVLIKRAALFTIAGGISYAAAILIQYGIQLHGPSGIALPIGIPVILLIGWWMYHEDYDDAEYENENEPDMKPE